MTLQDLAFKRLILRMNSIKKWSSDWEADDCSVCHFSSLVWFLEICCVHKRLPLSAALSWLNPFHILTLLYILKTILIASSHLCLCLAFPFLSNCPFTPLNWWRVQSYDLLSVIFFHPSVNLNISFTGVVHWFIHIKVHFSSLGVQCHCIYRCVCLYGALKSSL